MNKKLIFLPITVLVLSGILFAGLASAQDVGLRVEKSVKNITRGDDVWYSAINASSTNILMFRIRVSSTGSKEAADVRVRDILPQNIIYQGNLKIDGVSDSRNIAADNVDIGDLPSGQGKTITFLAKVGSNVATTTLINTALAYNEQVSETTTTKIFITGKGPTQVSTGVTLTILESFLFPLLIAFVVVWLFRSKLLGLDEIIEKRKEKIAKYRVEKELKKQINKMKSKI